MINMDSGTVVGLDSGGGDAVACGDTVTDVDNSTPTPVTFVDNSDLPPDVIPIPQDSTEVVESTNNDKKPGKNLQIAINFSGVELGAVTGEEGIDSVQVSISFGFSNLKGQSFKVDCTTSVPISGGTSAGSGASKQDRISSGGGGKTH